ncbi:FKBP-type peptidyl-prolyl cis-trans isomerase [Microbacterium sp. YY-01]|uniref:FKBP-type peptidyl-prolyl cis-trans isomerase n=1 Tax=Microbacterium sp. YY-01 TaxID=3421634 RepID=UPI003D16DFF9
MRKTPVALIALSLSAAALVGCAPAASINGVACERPSDTIGSLVDAEGKLGAEPRVDLGSPIHVSSTQLSDAVTGEGTAITDDNQLFSIDLVLYGGSDARRVVATEFNGDLSRLSNLDSWRTQIPGIAEALECATEGSRIIAAIAPEGLGESAAGGLGFMSDESAIAVIDVNKVFLPHAEGRLRFNAGTGLPSVVRAPDGRPGVTIPTADAPTDLVVETLIQGEGEEVTLDTPVRVHYTGLLWDDGSIFDTSWDGPARLLDLSSTIQGFTDALVGQKVGSQVMVVVPPELGYGSDDNATIPANSTLVFVIDIVGLEAGTQ